LGSDDDLHEAPNSLYRSDKHARRAMDGHLSLVDAMGRTDTI